MAGSTTTAGLVAAAARNHDPDRYVAALLAPRSVRADLVTLAALTGELARIGRMVREPMLAAMRLQWWRDALENGATTGYPVADDAIHMVRRLGVTAGVLGDLTRTAADIDAADVVAADEAGWCEAGAADAAAFRIALAIMGVAATPEWNRVAELAGEGFAVVRRLNAEAGDRPPPAGSRLSLPVAPWIEGVRARRDEVARHLAHASRAPLVALLPLALIEPYLRSLQEHDGGGVRARGGLTPLARAWCLWKARMTRRI